MVLSRKGLLSPVQESEETSRSPIESAAMSLCSPGRSLAHALNKRKLVNRSAVLEKVAKTIIGCFASGPLMSDDNPEIQRFSPENNALYGEHISIPACAPFLAPPACERGVECSSAAGHEEPAKKAQLVDSTRSAFWAVPASPFFALPRLGIPHIPPSGRPKCSLSPLPIIDPRPSVIKQSFEPCTALPVLRSSDRDTRMSGAFQESPSHSLSNSVKNGDFHATGNALT